MLAKAQPVWSKVMICSQMRRLRAKLWMFQQRPTLIFHTGAKSHLLSCLLQ